MFELIYRYDLQLFADAGNVVNTTTGTVNAYTGAATTTDAMSPSMKVFYDEEGNLVLLSDLPCNGVSVNQIMIFMLG